MRGVIDYMIEIDLSNNQQSPPSFIPQLSPLPSTINMQLNQNKNIIRVKSYHPFSFNFKFYIDEFWHRGEEAQNTH
jgi:hypothetical protein